VSPSNENRPALVPIFSGDLDLLDLAPAVRARVLGQRVPLDHVVERHLQEPGDAKCDRRAHLRATLRDLNALAVRQWQRPLDGEPVAESGTERAQAREDVLLLGEGQIAVRHGFT